MESIFNSARENQEEEDGLNLGEIKDRVFRNWKWFLLTCSLSFAIAFFFMRYSIPRYESRASIIVKQENKELGFLSELNLPVSPKNNINNELEILKSQAILSAVVSKLKLYQRFYLIGNHTKIQRKEIYEENPIDISYYLEDTLNHNVKNISFFLKIIDENRFEATFNGLTPVSYKYGDKIMLPKRPDYMVVRRTVLMTDKWKGMTMEVLVTSIEPCIAQLRTSIIANFADESASTTINLSLQGTSQVRNNVILDGLIKEYEIDGIREKNRIGLNTSAFINDRLQLIQDELSTLEQQGENFKTKNGLMDVQLDASSIIARENENEKQITDNEIQVSLVNFLLEYLKKTNDFNDLLPSNLGLEEASINRMTDEYNKIVSERNQQLQYANAQNPNIQKMEANLSSLRTSIEKSLKNWRSALEITLKGLRTKGNSFNNRFSHLPKFEREFRGIFRQQQIMEELFLHLLKKREENEMAQAATVGNSKIIEAPYSIDGPVFPKTSTVYLVALLAGILIPLGIFVLAEIFNTKVKSVKDLARYNFSVLGEVPFETEDITGTVESNYRTAISEAFRMLRANLAYVLSDTPGIGKTIAITSTIPKEGKTFTSIKLAMSLASTGKKVVLVGLDLRMPKLPEYLGIEDRDGVSNFIANSNMAFDDIVFPMEGKENLFIVSAGTIPPNPAELLMKPRLIDLLENLKSKFDYVITDLSPIGFVADSYPVIEYADFVLYIVRSGYLDKKMLAVPASLISDKKNTNLGIVLNFSEFGLKGYGYGYGYGYGNTSPQKKGESDKLAGIKNLFRKG
jgi:capsular exopolysaccharide synthesis family protein